MKDELDALHPHQHSNERPSKPNESPYSKGAEQSILDRAREEYAKLAAKKAFDDRAKNRTGRDWNEVIHISS